MPIGSAVAVQDAVLLVDWTNPDFHDVDLQPHDKFPEPNGVLAVAVPPGTDERYLVEFRVGRWEEGLDARWLTIWARAAVRDLKDYAAVAVDVRNAGEHPGKFHLKMNSHDGKHWWRGYGLAPGESYTVVVSIEELAESMDVTDAKAVILVVGKRPETDLRFQLGPVILVPKRAAD